MLDYKKEEEGNKETRGKYRVRGLTQQTSRQPLVQCEKPLVADKVPRDGQRAAALALAFARKLQPGLDHVYWLHAARGKHCAHKSCNT